jgi:hypothetical protein
MPSTIGSSNAHTQYANSAIAALAIRITRRTVGE